MKLFKWIAADPEKLDKETSYHVLLPAGPEWIFFDRATREWCWANERRIDPSNWPHIQVAVDAEVSEGFPEALIREAVRMAREGSGWEPLTWSYTEDEIVNELKKKHNA